MYENIYGHAYAANSGIYPIASSSWQSRSTPRRSSWLSTRLLSREKGKNLRPRCRVKSSWWQDLGFANNYNFRSQLLLSCIHVVVLFTTLRDEMPHSENVHTGTCWLSEPARSPLSSTSITTQCTLREKGITRHYTSNTARLRLQPLSVVLLISSDMPDSAHLLFCLSITSRHLRSLSLHEAIHDKAPPVKLHYTSLGALAQY